MTDVLDACRSSDVPAISCETGDFLAGLVRGHGSRDTLEIGTAHGYSTLRLAHAIGENGRILTIEFSRPSYEAAREYFARSGLSGRIEAVFADALVHLQAMPTNRTFDSVFVDGEKRRTVEFLDAVWPRIRPGGWIAVDDAIKFRWKMDGLDGWLANHACEYCTVRTDPDDGVLVIFPKK
ncbi:MAG TPA: class I SAM-dependent methyltransferase [bacterium]|nr:class I SAM-dependent methyltransferase [bacterium]